MVNIQHVTLNDMTQLVKLCMSMGIRGGLAKKGHNLMQWIASITKNEPNAVARSLSDGKDKNMSTISQHSPKKGNS